MMYIHFISIHIYFISELAKLEDRELLSDSRTKRFEYGELPDVPKFGKQTIIDF